MTDYNPASIDSILTRMEARQVGNTEKLEQILNKIDQHEERIERLEAFRWWLLGSGHADRDWETILAGL